ncbi:ADRM1 [Cordylochernes scorpioides]|uniref:ADRM1 n=1 Tax=Cordylochernes scorpioides TaxID=51811 RepID=A0ABY6JUW0_9ARAC|nr:ADRM1 [Cordylochernes scorpioides]
MTRPFLFGGTTGSQSQNKYLVEFRAGKMTMKGKMVTPDKRKGLVYINQTDDSLMHFCWKDRKTGTVEDVSILNIYIYPYVISKCNIIKRQTKFLYIILKYKFNQKFVYNINEPLFKCDLIIFPDDAEFKKVPQCTTGRVFVLKFKSSSRLVFYWMQEPKLDKDDELCSKVNEYLNNPPPVRGSGGSGGSSAQGGTDLSSLGEGEIHNIINNMSQQQLVQLLAGQMGVNINTSNLTSLLTAAGGRPTSSSASNLSERSATTTTTTTTSAPASTQPTVTQVSSAPVPRVPEPTTPSIQLAELQNILSGLNGTMMCIELAFCCMLNVVINQACLASHCWNIVVNQPSHHLLKHCAAVCEQFHQESASPNSSPRPQKEFKNSKRVCPTPTEIKFYHWIPQSLRQKGTFHTRQKFLWPALHQEMTLRGCGAAVDLNNAVTLEALQPLIDNAPLMERLRELLPPAATTDEGPPPPVSEQLRSTVQSPQFQQAMSMFSQALQLGQLGPLMQQFGMAQEVVDAANSGVRITALSWKLRDVCVCPDMDAFVKALQRSMKKPQDSNKKEEEDMNLD